MIKRMKEMFCSQQVSYGLVSFVVCFILGWFLFKRNLPFFIWINVFVLFSGMAFFLARIIDENFIKKVSIRQVLDDQRKRLPMILLILISVNAWYVLFEYCILSESAFYYPAILIIMIMSLGLHILGYRLSKAYHIVHYIVALYAVILLAMTYRLQ